MTMRCLLLCLSLVMATHAIDYYGDDSFYSDGYMNDDDESWSNRGMNSNKCVDIPSNMTLCSNIGYQKMRLPNLLEHDSMEEVVQQAKSWVPLVGIHCHPDSKLFLCSLFSPVCLDRPIWPCRSLCAAVKEGCADRMLKYGFPWPEMLRCDKFPEDNDLCITVQTKERSPQEEKQCKACKQPETVESIIDHYCSADFMMKVKVDRDVISGRDMKIETSKKKKILKKGPLKKRDVKDIVLHIEDGASCECGVIESGKKRTVLVAGKKSKGKLVVNYMIPYNKKKPSIRKALKAMRNGDKICDGTMIEVFDKDLQETETVYDKKNKNSKNTSQKNQKNDRQNRKERRRNKDRMRH